ncbi:MAG: poly-gamma-glutamate synthase PgsB [Tissierellia bacterium]|nr:poly-gamma-glutamate synthase PgsB [Tissierellia bacterium]
MILLFAISSIYIYFIWEKYYNEIALKSFKHVIMVNGIRGKTHVCRLIDSILRSKGYKVFTKTTGTKPFVIDTNGQEIPIKRIGRPNISEQFKIIRKAYKERAEIIIIECMAVNPEYQKVLQSKIVKSDIGIITNARYDHIFEMGKSIEDIANSLSATIPIGGDLFLPESDDFISLENKYKEKSNIHKIKFDEESIFDLNEKLAIAVSEFVFDNDGVDYEISELKNGIKSYLPDYGSLNLYTISEGNKINLFNLFSVNDPISANKILKNQKFDLKDMEFVFNNRRDRPDRILAFKEYFFNAHKEIKIHIVGENKFLAKRILKDFRLVIENNYDFLKKEDTLFIGLGNIKGAGEKILKLAKGGNS